MSIRLSSILDTEEKVQDKIDNKIPLSLKNISIIAKEIGLIKAEADDVIEEDSVYKEHISRFNDRAKYLIMTSEFGCKYGMFFFELGVKNPDYYTCFCQFDQPYITESINKQNMFSIGIGDPVTTCKLPMLDIEFKYEKATIIRPYNKILDIDDLKNYINQFKASRIQQKIGENYLAESMLMTKIKNGDIHYKFNTNI